MPVILSEAMQYLHRLRGRIAAHEKATSKTCAEDNTIRELGDMLPHYWREEADTPAEWWIRYARAIGLHATYDMLGNKICFRLTKDTNDEATITWPGKDH
mgnify:CR=1 FL=1